MHYPQQPPPGFYYPPQQPFVPPPRRGPDIRTIFRLIMLAVSLPCLGLVTYVIATHELEKKRDLVAFDNRLDQEAEVFVDGKLIGKVAAKHYSTEIIKLPKVAKHLEVHAGGKTVSSVELAIRPRGKDEKNGYRGLYVIGPAPRYAIAKVPYYADPKAEGEGPKLQRLGTPAPLVELPRELESYDMSSVDGSFLDSESLPEGTKVFWRTKLCTLDAHGDANCARFPKHDVEP